MRKVDLGFASTRTSPAQYHSNPASFAVTRHPSAITGPRRKS
jgi:hypothetical protein